MTDSGYSVIFDMDGVLVDNRAMHTQAWRDMAAKLGLPFSEKRFTAELFGRTNPAILRGLYGYDLPAADVERLAEEKEARYREIHRGRVVPTAGLAAFLEVLLADGATLAVATSAPRANLDFFMSETGLRRYFQVLVDVGQVKNGKPDPEIYLRAAEALRRPPRRCVAVEDSLPGVASALAAGMKVVAVTTTHPASELMGALLAVADFRSLTADAVRALLETDEKA
jgi:beta-phosphoglucomutase